MGTEYRRITGYRNGSQQYEPSNNLEVGSTLLGSFTNTYLPSGIFIHMSVTVRTIPQPLAKETLSWAAKSVGRIEAVLRMTCRVLSRGFPREIYLRQKLSECSKWKWGSLWGLTRSSWAQRLQAHFVQSTWRVCSCCSSSPLRQQHHAENPILTANQGPHPHLELEDQTH